MRVRLQHKNKRQKEQHTKNAPPFLTSIKRNVYSQINKNSMQLLASCIGGKND